MPYKEEGTSGAGLVSIIMPTWNCGPFIARSIESVLAQTYTDWELLITDDCSTDDTRAIVSAYSARDPRIKYRCLPHNSGAAVARNEALRRAKGRWVAFLDSDDLWKPGKLEKQVCFMTANGIAFSYHPYAEIDEEDRPLGIKAGGRKRVGRLGMFSCCWPGCLTVMYDAGKVGLIQIADLKKNNDSAMWLKAIRKADCHLLPEELAQYRRRKGSITPPGVWEKVKWHYLLFRKGEGMGRVRALFWTAANIAGNSYKKLAYRKKENPL